MASQRQIRLWANAQEENEAGSSNGSPSYSLTTYFKSFLYVTDAFQFLRIGPDCNGSRSSEFTKANCNLQKIREMHEPRGARLPLGVVMGDLFERGFNLLRDEISGEVTNEQDRHSGEEYAALTDLCNFLRNIKTHGRNILSACEKMENNSSKETILTMALAEHLFSKLATGYCYNIDERATGKEAKTFGRDKPINFEATGIGHHRVWHGHADILMSTNEEQKVPVLTASIVTDTILLSDEDPRPPTTKRAKSSDEEYGGLSSNNLGHKGTEDQTVAQTLVFALAQKCRNPGLNIFIPNIVICQKTFCIVMYEPENDILIWSETFPLWSDSSSLDVTSVIALWMVLHYKLFGSGGDIFENVDEIKAGFMEHIEEDRRQFYEQLQVGVSSFETKEQVDYLIRGTFRAIQPVKLKNKNF